MSEAASDRAAVIQACQQVMRESEAAYFTTLDDDGAPCTRAVFNLRREGQFPAYREIYAAADDPLLVHVSTNTSSEKVRQLRREPRVSMYYCVPGTFHGVMLSGEVAEVGDEAVKDRFWQPGWEIYYPQGMRDPDYTILEMRPARARGWLGGKAFDIRLGSRA